MARGILIFRPSGGGLGFELHANGFKKYLRKDFDISLKHAAMTDVVPELRAVGELVTTVGAAPLIEATST